MKKVLVIYENVPETTNLYLLDVEEDTFNIMKLCHGHYINGNDENEEIHRAINILSLMLGPRTDDNLQWAAEMSIPHELVGMYSGTEITGKGPIYPTEKIDMVINTGWIL